MTTGIFF